MKNLPYLYYGLLGLPLAMVALPVYVQIPNYYTTQFGLPLATTGVVLFIARMIDTLQDPYLGRIVDRLGCTHRGWLIGAVFLLIACFAGMWLPPDMLRSSTNVLLAWLAVMLVGAYTAHSMLNIAYLTWGSNIARLQDESGQAQAQQQLLGAAAWRESFGLVGVILASIVPSWILLQNSTEIRLHMFDYVLGFSLVLAVSLLALQLGAPKPIANRITADLNWRGLMSQSRFRRFRRLLGIYFLNSLSVAIPASLILFFINDRIQAPEKTALFLASYFIAGACGLPVWIQLAKRIGTASTWQCGMLIGMICFIGASLLGRNDVTGFLIVCIASGFALGADLALPPVLLTLTVHDKFHMGAYLGLWSLTGKFSLALAGLSLSLLSLLGYQVQSNQTTPSDAGLLALSMTYALLPCLLKLLAFFLLRHFSKSISS